MHNDAYIKVIENPSLRRDSQTNAIIDVDTDSYSQYIRQKQERISQRERFQQLEERINNFESDISDIKSLLTRLLEKS